MKRANWAWIATCVLFSGGVACSSGVAGTPASEETTGHATQSLAPNGTALWAPIPGPSGVTFIGRPSIVGQYADAGSRTIGTCATSNVGTIYCTYRVIIGFVDSNWAPWTVQSAPPNVKFGTGPVEASWPGQTGGDAGALAAREANGTCPNCIRIRVQEETPGTQTWFIVPSSGIADGFTGEISMAYSSGTLFLFGMKGSDPYSAYYTENFVQGGYSNANWKPWKAVPGGGQFFKPITATALRFGDVLLAGVGSDKQAWYQKTTGRSFAGFWTNVGPGGHFKDSPYATSFSGLGDDIEFFGLCADSIECEGDLNAAHTVFDGWWNFSDNTFFSSPAANMSGDKHPHVDLVARGNTQQLLVGSYDPPATCADGTVEQFFRGGVVGCAGKVAWSSRASLCGAGTRVCRAADWVAARGTSVPTHNYWTDQDLRYVGSGTGACFASVSTGSTCGGNPMRVCTANGSDAEGNQCNWQQCGLETNSPQNYFGGCANNTTAGALCCPP